MSRIRLILVSPSFLVPSGLLLGGLLARSSPTYSGVIDQVYSLLKSETAPSVVLALTAGLGMVAIGTLFPSLGDFFTGTPGVKIDKQSERADVQQSADEARAAWVTERLAPWRKFLEVRGELALLPEIEARFNDRARFATPPVEAKNQDLWLVGWLVEKAATFAAGGVDDAVSAKIHNFVEEAFRLAAQHDGWLRIKGVPNAHNVVAPVFKGQAAIYKSQCSGSPAFVDFLVWLATA